MDIKEFDVLKTYKEEAYNDIQANKFESAQINCRKGLEFAVKKLCQIEKIQNTKHLSLEDLINLLSHTNFGSDEYIKLMHDIRKKSNSGAHVTLDGSNQVKTISKEEATEIYNLIEDLYDNIKDYVLNYEQLKATNNRPFVNPDYYSSKRRYYGQWARSRSLFTDDDFNKLFRRAVNQEDIEAMLDLAIGFVDNESEFFNNLIYNDVEHDGNCATIKGLNNNYYYWVLRAMYFTRKKYKQNKYIPKKYIATAIWDAYVYMKFNYTHIVRYARYLPRYDNNPTDTNVKNKKLNDVWRNSYAIGYFRTTDPNFDLLNDVYLSLVDVTTDLYPFLETIFTGKDVIAAVHTGANINTLQKIREYNQFFKDNTREKVLAKAEKQKAERLELQRKQTEAKNLELKNDYMSILAKRLNKLTEKYKEVVDEYNKKSSNLALKLLYKDNINSLKKEKLTLEDKINDTKSLIEEISKDDLNNIKNYSYRIEHLGIFI